jgi:hypothetical protein
MMETGSARNKKTYDSAQFHKRPVECKELRTVATSTVQQTNYFIRPATPRARAHLELRILRPMMIIIIIMEVIKK